MAVLAVGVVPENTLAKKVGLELGLKGAIKVNDKMETSVPDIYAVGDAVQVKHFITEHDAVISLAGPANKQGRIVADNICGISSKYNGSQGSSIIKLFDMTVATTGINEQQAGAGGYEYEKVILLLDAFVTVFGYMLAVLCICSVGMVFLITLFAKCGVAMG